MNAYSRGDDGGIAFYLPFYYLTLVYLASLYFTILKIK